MDGQELLERVRAETETERSRLASDKALLAATDATLEAEAVLGVVAGALDAGRRRLGDWADEAADPVLGDALADGADRLEALCADHRETLPAEPSVSVADPLGEPAGDLERAAAGLVGLPLVLDPLLLQAVNFFVNEADTATADELRAVRDGVAEIREGHRAAVAERATAEGREDAAVGAAVAVIEAAYADYAESLAAMGLDPKPIC